MGKRWTDKENQILRTHYADMPNRELQKLISNRSIETIKKKARKLGLWKSTHLYGHGNPSFSNKGRKLSEKWCRHISEGKKGRPAWNKGIPMTEEAKRKLSEARKGIRFSPTTEFKKGHIPWNKGLKIQTNTGRTHFKKGQVPLIAMRNSRKSCAVRPSKPEAKFMRICKDYNLPFTYTGDGSFWVDRMNPDFVDFDGKTVVEIFGEYWHDSTKREVPERQTEEGRVSALNDAGWAAIVIWEDELNNPEIVINMINSVGEMR